ncbi:MAG TPA: hypothetical protein VGV38_03595 [Pyrinomonadaceae bacterium]|nr:hypothetical protein [Pyrinomonadaceae bacterium]
MRVRRLASGSLALAALVAAFLFTYGAQAQQERDRPSRRTTNPTRPQPAVPVPTPRPTPADDVTLVRDATDPQAEEGRRTTRRTPARTTRRRAAEEDAEADTVRRTVEDLSSQVNTLSRDVNELKGQQRTLVSLERLSRAEQRAENFRTQLRDVTEKELNLQGRLEQLDYELQPDNVQRRAALTGTLRPDELRAQIQRQLEGERRRVQQQLDLLNTSRVRLESAVATADLEVERLKAQLEEDERLAREQGATGTNPAPNATTTAQPRATPRPRPTPETEPDEPDNNPR